MSDKKLDKLADAVIAACQSAEVEGFVFSAVDGDRIQTAGAGPPETQKEATGMLMTKMAMLNEEGELPPAA